MLLSLMGIFSLDTLSPIARAGEQISSTQTPPYTLILLYNMKRFGD